MSDIRTLEIDRGPKLLLPFPLDRDILEGRVLTSESIEEHRTILWSYAWLAVELFAKLLC